MEGGKGSVRLHAKRNVGAKLKAKVIVENWFPLPVAVPPRTVENDFGVQIGATNSREFFQLSQP